MVDKIYCANEKCDKLINESDAVYCDICSFGYCRTCIKKFVQTKFNIEPLAFCIFCGSDEAIEEWLEILQEVSDIVALNRLTDDKWLLQNWGDAS